MIAAGEFADLVGPDFRAWLKQMERLGGCASPVYLVGHSITRDRATGEVLHVFTSASQPYGRYAVGCGNRRESVCLPCSYLHHGDTYQLVVAGLAGGKGVPPEVAGHPRVFATLTAPSFGAVHRVADPDRSSELCRARRDAGVCEHGASGACYARHEPGDALVGVPLCAGCYDYAGAVLWNASMGALWDRFVGRVRRGLAKGAGIRGRDLPLHARVSFAKVAEYQHRGSVHLHAVIRVDGPDGPGDPAPSWASAELLREVVSAAGPWVRVRIEDAAGRGRVLRFGRQLDVQEITPGGGLDGLNDAAVAAYIAKYVTKGDLPGLVLPNRLRSAGQIDTTPGLSQHARTLMRTAWELAGAHEGLRLRLWSHQLGFRGQVATKSRAYSTTYTALRAARADFHRDGKFDPELTERESSWRFDRAGHSPSAAAFAAGIARGVADARAARHGRAGNDSRAGGRVDETAGRSCNADGDQNRAPRGAGGRV